MKTAAFLFILGFMSCMAFGLSNFESNNLRPISIYFRDSLAKDAKEWGVIEYDTFMSEGLGSIKYLNDEHSSIGCLESKDHEQFTCRALINASISGNEIFTVFLNDKGEVENINYVNTGSSHNSENESKVIVVGDVKRGPSPELKKPIVLVNNQVPEQETEKSFLQKYGLYLIPLGLLLLLGGGGEQ